MKCTACGNENQPGAKFCVHCGVVLSAATPAYVPTPAPSPVQTGPRPVMPAPAPTPPAALQTGPGPVTPGPAAPPAAPAMPPPSPPVATAASSRTLGMAIAAIAGVVVLVGGGYFGYRMFGGEGSKQTTAATEAPKAEALPAAEAPKEAGANAAGAPPEGQPANVATTAPAGNETPSATSGASGAAQADNSGLPGQPAVPQDKAAQARAAATAKAQARATPPPGAPAPGATGAATTTPATPAPAKAPGKTNLAQAAVQPDRWQQYADEMTRCAKEDFFSRVVCQQKVRARYCEGYWGKVPQCPGNAPVDHGQ